MTNYHQHQKNSAFLYIYLVYENNVRYTYSRDFLNFIKVSWKNIFHYILSIHINYYRDFIITIDFLFDKEKTACEQMLM